MKNHHIIIGFIVILLVAYLFPNFFSGVKRKIDNKVSENYSVEIFEEKSKQLRTTFVKVNQRIYLIDNKMSSYKIKIDEITKYYNPETVKSDPKVKSKLDMYTKIYESLGVAKTKLENLRDKIKVNLENYTYNIEVLKNKEVLRDSLREVNSYLKEFNMDNSGIDPDNINNIIDESIIKEEAILHSYEELESME